MIPGEYILKNEEIIANRGRKTTKIEVNNTGDRPVQIGSHYHFFEANKELEFDRTAALGMRLNIPSSTAVRFEPGEKKEVILVEFAGDKKIIGFSNLLDGKIDDKNARNKAIKKAKEEGFKSNSK